MNGKKTHSFFYGWVIVAAVWLIYFFTNDPPCYGTNVISARLVLEHGWSEGVAGLSLSFHYLAIGLAAVPAGFLIQKIGAKRTIFCGALIGIVSYCILRRVESEVVYELMFFILGISVSACASVACPSLINEWFEKNKSLPMAILMTAGGIGGFLFPILSEKLTSVSISLPWRVYAGMSAAAALIAVFVVKNHPADVGEEKDGAGRAKEEAAAAGEVKEEAAAEEGGPADVSLGEAARSFPFYSLGLMVFAARGIFSGYVSYCLLYSVENGVALETATAILSFYSAVSLAGRMLAAFIDRLPMPVHVLAAADYGLLALGPLCLIFAKNVPMFVFVAFCIGFGFGLQNTLFPLLVPRHFGNRYFSVIYGAYNMIGSFGATLAPMMVLSLRNATGSYRPGFAVMAAFGAVSMALAYVTREKSRARG